jgi:hypothetical protein
VAAKKHAELLHQAHEARDVFYRFANTHPEIHQKRGGEVPPIDVLVQKHKIT